jgi:aspartyl-tRNA(Asn)/glutamyl-tRNA(Gln) amidotransferase subunit A
MRNEELINLTLTEALAKLKSREITAADLTKAYLDEIEKDDSNSYITVTTERALADAAESDRRYADGTARPLEGIPIGISDLFMTKGIRSTAGSKMLENFIPEYESTISQKLADAGCVLLGKTNCDEFGMGTSYFGKTGKPASALAAAGADTNGGVRSPAVRAGLIGMRPTYGLCSRFGLAAYASSMDTPGATARTVDDAALMLSAMAGHDEKESTSAPNADDIAKSLAQPLSALPLAGLKIGIVKEFGNVEISDEMRKAFDVKIIDLKSGGTEIIEVSIPHILDAAAVYHILASAEASSNLMRYDGMRFGLRADGDGLDGTYVNTRTAGFGLEVKQQLVVGAEMLSGESIDDYYFQAMKARRLIANEFNKAFEQCDLIIAPANKGLTTQEYVWDLFSIGMNLVGIPACGVPVASGGIGLQIVGRRFDDLRVLQLAKNII